MRRSSESVAALASALAKAQAELVNPEKSLTATITCKIWYLISRTVSEDDAHRDNIDGRSVGAVAAKPRALGAPLCGIGACRSARPNKPDDHAANALTTLHDCLTTSDRSSAGFLK